NGRNVRHQAKHVMVICSILNDSDNLWKPDQHYTVALYSKVEDYTLLKKVLALLIQDLHDIVNYSIMDEFGNLWNVKLYFFSDWKFLALYLGLNSANAKNFCPYCSCNKKEIGLYNKK
ncbi:42147_t:CDS:1, partial [Gigaspora margarita]